MMEILSAETDEAVPVWQRMAGFELVDLRQHQTSALKYAETGRELESKAEMTETL
jgi:hypothetical protein